MELIIRNVGTVLDSQHRKKPESLIAFNSDRTNGYIPLIQLYQTLNKRTLFNENLGSIDHFDTLKNVFSFHHAYTNYSFRQQLIGYQRRDIKYINISMLSLFGIKTERRSTVNTLRVRIGQPVETILLNNIDVFSLCLVKLNKVSNVRSQGRNMLLDTKDLLVLVSKQKLKSPAYMNINYNSTARIHLWRGYREYLERNKVKMEIVNDSELARYHYNPYSLKESSIMELMKIDKAIKEDLLIKNKEYINYD